MSVRCSACGQTWAKDPALAVPCPICQARAGVNCRRPSGHPCELHMARDQAALDAGVLERCRAAIFLETGLDIPAQQSQAVSKRAKEPLQMAAKTVIRGGDLAERTVIIKVEMGKAGSSRQASTEKVEVNADKLLLRLRKVLLDCPEFLAVKNLDTRVRRYLDDTCLPCDEVGRRFLPIELIERVDGCLQEFAAERAGLVDVFMARYEGTDGQGAGLPEIMIVRLGDLSAIRDFPPAAIIRAKFYLGWSYVAYGVPDKLKAVSAQIWKKERDKAAGAIASAQAEITDALRAGFLKLVSHMRQILEPGPDGKPKTFHESSIGKLREFLEIGDLRNVTDDAALRDVMAKARALLAGGLTGEDLRAKPDLRAIMRAEFAVIEKKLDGLVINKGTRRYRDEEAA